MKASEIMTTPVVSIRVDATVREATALLARHRIASMPVLDEDGNVVGIVSEIDLLRNRIPRDPRAHMWRHSEDRADPGRRVADVMSETVVCLSENADAADVVDVMLTNRVRAVPIISGADLIGIISSRDLLRSLLRDDSEIRSEVERRLAGYVAPGEQCVIYVQDGVVTLHGHLADERRREGAIAMTEGVPGVVRVHDRSR
jgi:CBS domain-containing protein